MSGEAGIQKNGCWFVNGDLQVPGGRWKEGWTRDLSKGACVSPAFAHGHHFISIPIVVVAPQGRCDVTGVVKGANKEFSNII
jgi:hypothetical protein